MNTDLERRLRDTITERCKDAEACADGYQLNIYGDALLAVLDAHSPGEGEVVFGECEKPEHGGGFGCECVRRFRCPKCVRSWADEETQTSPCDTVKALATALGVAA